MTRNRPLKYHKIATDRNRQKTIFILCQKFSNLLTFFEPGPASSVKEHSLLNILRLNRSWLEFHCMPGFFQARLIIGNTFDIKSSKHVGKILQPQNPIQDIRKAVADQIPLNERDHSSQNI